MVIDHSLFCDSMDKTMAILYLPGIFHTIHGFYLYNMPKTIDYCKFL